MKALRMILMVVGSIMMISTAYAQDVGASLQAANSAYSSNDVLIARENLQKALVDINDIIGKEILALMPSSLGGLEFDKAQDNIIGNTGFAGLLVTRSYGNDNKKINVTLANDSPMLAAVNAFLGNGMLSGLMAAQTGQKQISISGFKGMLEKAENEEGPSIYTINVPVGDSLFTFESTGFDSESDVVVMAGLMNLDKIATLLK